VHYSFKFLAFCKEQEAQLMLTNARDAFRSQWRSPNMVLCMVSY